MSDVRSALGISVGPVTAAAALVEVVGGRPRLAASGRALTSSFSPHGDAVSGARAAVAQVEIAVGRPLFATGALVVPRRDGAGVDAVGTALDARPTVCLIGFGDRAALFCARRAVAALDPAALDEIELDARTDATTLSDRLRGAEGHAAPDALVLVGPGDAPALAKLADAVAMAWPSASAMLPVIWAGEAAGASVARAVLSPRCDLRVVSPVRPRPETEHFGPLRGEIATIWRESIDERLPGAGVVAKWSDRPAVPAGRALERALAHVSALRGLPVFYARLEGASAQVLLVEGGAAGRTMTARGDVDDLPRRTRPWSLAATASDARALKALAAETLRVAAHGLPSDARPSRWTRPTLLVAAGDLAQLGPAELLEALVDGLEPCGAVQFLVDELDVLRPLGALVDSAPALIGPILTGDALRPVGGLLAPGWRGRAGASAFRYSAGAPGIEIRAGAHVGVGETTRLAVDDGQRMLVRADRPKWWDPRRLFDQRLQLEIEGGPIGVLLDGRTRGDGAALTLGRTVLHDDAAAPVVAGGPVVARPMAAGAVALRRARPLPPDARLLVGPGDTVGSDELIAQDAGRGEHAAPTILTAGRALGTADPRPYLLRQNGARVRAGEVIARRRMLFGLVERTVVAPVDGVLAAGLGGFGNLSIVPASEGRGIPAHVPGVVVATLPDAVVIETKGQLLSAALGYGVERRGPLLAPSGRFEMASEGRSGRLAGAVAVVDVLDRGQLEAMRASGLAGVVAGSVESSLARELVLVPPDMAVLVLEGVGIARLPDSARELLAASAGRLICLSPAAPVRARSWSEAIIPVDGPERARALPEPSLAVGARVRVVGESTAHGTVAAILPEPLRFPSGATAAAVEVELASGGRARVPLPNLELVG